MKIALFGNSYQEKYKAQLADFVFFLKQAGELIVEENFSKYLVKIGIDTNDVPTFADDTFEGASIAVSIGGDGTLLSKAALMARTSTPVVGVNTGHLGYLAACRLNEAQLISAGMKTAPCCSS